MCAMEKLGISSEQNLSSCPQVTYILAYVWEGERQQTQNKYVRGFSRVINKRK